MSLSCSTFNVSRYLRDPTMPISSAPHSAKRTACLTAGALPSCTAVSSTAATPEPLSLMPGPSGTLSRWAPTMTTSAPDPVVVWAITLRVVIVTTRASSTTVAGPGSARSRAPCALLTLITGMPAAASSPRVPPIFSSSTLLATTSATAPSLATTSCFCAKGQMPRSTSTTAPATGRPS